MTASNEPPVAASVLFTQFREANSRGQIPLWRCLRCGQSRLRVHLVCPRCGDKTPAEALLASGEGTVWSFCTYHKRYDDNRDIPYVVSVVELAEGVHIVSEVQCSTSDELSIGLPVHISNRTPQSLLVFEPTNWRM